MTLRQLALVLCCLAIPLPAAAQSQGGGGMQKYVIERDLPGAGQLSPSELQAISKKSREVLRGSFDEHPVGAELRDRRQDLLRLPR